MDVSNATRAPLRQGGQVGDTMAIKRTRSALELKADRNASTEEVSDASGVIYFFAGISLKNSLTIF